LITEHPAARPEANLGFAPVDNELPLRWLRRLHVVPENGLGTVRRALFFAALTWLPLAVWAAMTGRAVLTLARYAITIVK